MRSALVLCAAMLCAPAGAAEPVALSNWQIQPRSDANYFWVGFAAPPHVEFASLAPEDDGPRAVVRVGGLDFVGKWPGSTEQASFRLTYSIREPAGTATTHAHSIVLKRAAAAKVDLEGIDLKVLWAKAQLAELAELQKRAPDFTFYFFARVMLARKYGLPVPADIVAGIPSADAGHRQIFETNTGGAAVAESLQLRRLLTRRGADEARIAQVASLPGVDVPGHPWEKMTGERRPAAEPLAELVPADNYYVCFRDMQSLLEFGDLLDLWGTNLIHALEFQNRDAGVRGRYERQLCLPSRRLAGTVQADGVRGIALTGSDPYLVDGTDITAILHLREANPFLKQHDVLIQEARERFRGQWQSQRHIHLDVPIESFTTPQREVSLHRAVIGEFVICSNSLTALMRVLDARAGAIPALGRALDFKYMRTNFRADDPAESGFAFLPDALIRRMMGPADKIKQRRRAEAQGRLALVQSAALLAGWDEGKIPADSLTLQIATGLDIDSRRVAEGPPISWDGATGTAHSEAYNTLQFATPLIELPIDKVTPSEQRDYESFRRDYLRLWRQFFDPVGIRFTRNNRRVRVEAYILPLIQSERYQLMRQICGGEPYAFDASMTPPGTLMQLQLKLDDGMNPTWVVLRLDDDPAFDKRMELLLRPNRSATDAAELERAFWRLPLTIGVGVGVQNARDIETLRDLLRNVFLAGALPTSAKYRGTDILRYPVKPEDLRGKVRQLKELAPLVSGSDATTLAQLLSFLPDKEMPEFIYQAFVGEGYYLSLREECLQRLIDREANRQADLAAGKKPEAAPANTSLFIATGARSAGGGLRQYLEAQTRDRALAGNAMWLPLYRAGVVGKDASRADERSAALRWYGFEPVSPDGASYRYDRHLGEVVNTRHGNFREPVRHATLAADAPARKLLEQFRAIRTDLRFREDGIHTTVTFERP